jgi:hypothetical protein
MSEPGTQDQPDEATVDLLVKQVVEGLSPAEQRALDSWGNPARLSQENFERAAAALTLAAPIDAQLPAGLRARLEQRAAEYVTSMSSQAQPQPPVEERRRGAGTSRWGWLAAAACLVLAVLGWVRSPRNEAPPVAEVAPPTVTAPPPTLRPAPTLQEQFARLAAKPDTIKVTMAATKDPAAAGVSGIVVWDPVTQQGFLRLVGLASNDPTVHQYQLWVFDGERDKRYPVDGGVFDVPANASEVLIPINAKLMVHKPAAFAVTIEKPGGVVVSARDHVVALGAAS